jgi:hypothetical protein
MVEDEEAEDEDAVQQWLCVSEEETSLLYQQDGTTDLADHRDSVGTHETRA